MKRIMKKVSNELTTKVVLAKAAISNNHGEGYIVKRQILANSNVKLFI